MITVGGDTPNYTNPVTGSVKLTFNPKAIGQYSYGWQWSPKWKVLPPLVSELSDYANAAGWGTGGGTYTFNVDGKSINVVTGASPINDQQATSITYTVQSGTELSTNAYTITNVKATPHAGATAQDIGYEQLNFTFHPTKNAPIEDGSYLDVKLGLPDSQGKVTPYDTTLSASFPITYDGQTVGTVYNMGTYYRIVFNSNMSQYATGNNDLKLNFNFKWGHDKSDLGDNGHAYQQPSVGVDQDSTDNLGKTLFTNIQTILHKMDRNLHIHQIMMLK